MQKMQSGNETTRLTTSISIQQWNFSFLSVIVTIVVPWVTWLNLGHCGASVSVCVLILFTGHQSKTCGHGHSDQGSRVPSFWLDAPPSMPVMQVSWHQEDWQLSHASRNILIKKCYGPEATSEHLIEQNLSWACSDTSGCLCHTSMVSTLFQNAYCITACITVSKCLLYYCMYYCFKMFMTPLIATVDW